MSNNFFVLKPSCFTNIRGIGKIFKKNLKLLPVSNMNGEVVMQFISNTYVALNTHGQKLTCNECVYFLIQWRKY